MLLLNVFYCTYGDADMVFLSIWRITLIDFQMTKQLCVSGISPVNHDM